MASLEEKRDYIFKYEEQFSRSLSQRVIEKPKINVFMILIPILFLYFLYQNQRYKIGRKLFAEKYLILRKQALDEAYLCITTDRNIDAQSIINKQNISDPIKSKIFDLISLLIDHYILLLRGEGEDIYSLVKSVYRSISGYKKYIKSLNDCENALNEIILAELSLSNQDIDKSVTDRITQQTIELRNDLIKEIFK